MLLRRNFKIRWKTILTQETYGPTEPWFFRIICYHHMELEKYSKNNNNNNNIIIIIITIIIIIIITIIILIIIILIIIIIIIIKCYFGQRFYTPNLKCKDTRNSWTCVNACLNGAHCHWLEKWSNLPYISCTLEAYSVTKKSLNFSCFMAFVTHVIEKITFMLLEKKILLNILPELGSLLGTIIRKANFEHVSVSRTALRFLC